MSCRFIPFPRVEPNHADGVDFSQELPIPDGVIKRIQIDLRGTVVGTITSVGMDSPARLLQRIRIEFPRVGEKSYVIDSTGRDLARLAELLNAIAPNKRQPSSAAAASWIIDLPLFVPGKMAGHEWGIDTRELTDKILVSGTWANASQYGGGATSITSGQARVNLCVTDEEEQPRFALLPVTTRMGVDSATTFTRGLGKAELDGAYAVLLRTFDASAAINADRVDGLFTRAAISHSIEGELLKLTTNEALKSALQAEFQIPNAELNAAAPNGYAGMFGYVFNPELFPGFYPDLVGADLALDIDAETTQPTGVTNVVPAAGDAVFATLIGVQANDLMLAEIDG